MTDPAEQAERLARLRQRRAGTAGSSAPADSPALFDPPPAGAAPIARVQPTPPTRNGIDNTTASPGPATKSRRRSTATTAKIVTVGASTTAVLGMMAGYGIADRAAASKPVLVPADDSIGTASTTTVTPAAAPAPTAPPPTAAPPQVVVVVIDGATGLPVSGEVDLSTLATTPPGAVVVAEPGAPAPNDTLTPAPVAAPTAVDLAVPAPPPPRPAAPAAAPAPGAPAAAPAPAPQPEATSEGS